MIDTDKYEGHTEGPWTIAWWEGTWYVDDEDDNTVCRLDGTAQKQDPTAKLIQDAPLLLAEVKRLRGLLKANECCTACGKYLGQCNDEDECIRLGGWTMEEVEA
jgi:hypothetical protein|tara:strand:+ start:637 stop:948 length:312 start_codon:yes stop_codon:yes gene_type:complete